MQVTVLNCNEKDILLKKNELNLNMIELRHFDMVRDRIDNEKFERIAN